MKFRSFSLDSHSSRIHDGVVVAAAADAAAELEAVRLADAEGFVVVAVVVAIVVFVVPADIIGDLEGAVAKA